jgi:hypothetical protein
MPGVYTQAVEENALPETIHWRDWSGYGLEHAALSKKARYIEVQSAVICGPIRAGFAALYSLKLDRGWCVIEMQASLLGTAESVYLRRTEEGHWFDGNNRSLLHLNGIFDVDLSITPFTNTLPIRRLRLGVGESAEIVTAYVAFPQLTVSVDPQRYTRVAADRYKYESLDRDFVREITVDGNGFVITYPGLFQRIE